MLILKINFKKFKKYYFNAIFYFKSCYCPNVKQYIRIRNPNSWDSNTCQKFNRNPTEIFESRVLRVTKCTYNKMTSCCILFTKVRVEVINTTRVYIYIYIYIYTQKYHQNMENLQTPVYDIISKQTEWKHRMFLLF